MVAKVGELHAWMQQKRQQQISYPLDEASKTSMGVPSKFGSGSKTLTQSITIPNGGGSANVPAAYSGSIVLLIEGGQYEIPYL